MAKNIFSIDIECFNANKNKNGTNAQFANNIKQEQQGLTSREAVQFTIPDIDLAEKLKPGKKYTITITEK